MSSRGNDYRRISGLARPLAECKTEVRFNSIHCVHFAAVVLVVNTSKYDICNKTEQSNVKDNC